MKWLSLLLAGLLTGLTAALAQTPGQREMDRQMVEYAKPVDYRRVSSSKLLVRVLERMEARIRYAKSSDVRSIDNTAIYAVMGFRTPEAFCKARDSEYRMLEELLKESYK